MAFSYSQYIRMNSGDNLEERDFTVGPPVDSVVEKGLGEYHIYFGTYVSGGLVFGGYVWTDNSNTTYPGHEGWCNGYIDRNTFSEGSSPDFVIGFYDDDGEGFAMESGGVLTFDDNLVFWTSGDDFASVFVGAGDIEYDGVVDGLLDFEFTPSSGTITLGHTVLVPGPPMPFWSWDPDDDGLGGAGNWNTIDLDLNWDYTPPPDSGDNAVWENGFSAAFETGSGVVTINEGGEISVYDMLFDSPDGAYIIDAATAGDSLNLLGGTITAETNATINAKVTASDFAKLGSGALTLNDISGLTGTINVTAGTLTLGDRAGLPGGVTGVTFGADSTLVNSIGGMNWTSRTITVNGDFRIAGNHMMFADIDPGADGRVINVDNITHVSRFTGDRSDVVFGGTGLMILGGSDSDFSGCVYIEGDLVVLLEGMGEDMLGGQPVSLSDNAVLGLLDYDQLGTSDIRLHDNSTLDFNSFDETVGHVYLLSPDAKIALGSGIVDMAGFDADSVFGGATIDTGTSGRLTLTDSTQHFNRDIDSAAVTIAGSGMVNHDGDTNWHVNDSSADIDLRVDAKITGNGSTVDGVVVFDGGGTVQLTNPDNHFNMKISDGRVMISDTGAVLSDEELKIESEGELLLDGGQVNAPGLRIDTGGALSGHGTVTGKVSTSDGSTITADGGTLTLGDASQFAAFNHRGEMYVGAAAVVVNSKGFANLGPLTTLAGGTLSADNGVVLGMGDNLVGFGAVDARVSAGFGSTIEATGDLEIGDAAALDGFQSDGVLVVADNTVTINDANQAVLGSLTQLGTDTDDGTLLAGNGLLVEFGKNIAGRGVVNTPNDESLPLMNNGVIIGDFPGAIELTGYVKGVGMLENVTVSGTLSPGFSPVRLHANNLEIGSGGQLIMELSGLTGGSEYDQLDVAGTLQLDGTLQVSLMDGFAPSLGDTFDILDWGALDGAEFAAVELPELAGRKTWDTSGLYTTGEISVIAMLAGDTDGDRDVDGADYAAFVGVFGAAGDRYTDFNEDGRVDLEDFVIMRGNFGFGVPASSPDAGANVPEPGTLALLALGGLAMLRRRRLQTIE
jgi:hypothetical protein